MGRRLILDTGVLIAAGRARNGLAGLIDADDDVVIAAVSVAELYAGIEMASERHRADREAYANHVLSILPVIDYDLATAREHAKLLAYVQRLGATRSAHDLIIAATAAATGRTILTSSSIG